MIRVVGANPAMDRIATWSTLRLGEVNRAVDVTVVPGGKGFNVARAVIRLGAPAAAYGFLGGHVGEGLREMIRADGVVDRHTTIAAGTRVCFIVVEPGTGRVTVLNEPGPAVTSGETEQFLSALRAECQADDLVVLAGSLPDSVGPEVAAEIVAIGNSANARTVVDIHSAALVHAVRQQPWMLKCNRGELLDLLGLPDTEDALPLSALAHEIQQLRARGIEHVVVTMGSEGALVADRDGVVHASVPAIDAVNATGSGDLLLAGLVVGVERGSKPRDAIALGGACGTAGATHLAPELPFDFVADEWIERITIEDIEPLKPIEPAP